MRGILMIEPLYHQVIKGAKTQTRRSGGLDEVNGREAVIKKGVEVKPAIISNPDDWELCESDISVWEFLGKDDKMCQCFSPL